jgi:predicted Kef-type K+ transport protein
VVPINPHFFDFIRDHLFTLPVLAKFALGTVMLVTVPRLCRYLRIPSAVGLLLDGVIIGPYVLGFLARTARSRISRRNSASCC